MPTSRKHAARTRRSFSHDVSKPVPAQQVEHRCAVFERAREAACSDPDLGRIWLNLFDDADI